MSACGEDDSTPSPGTAGSGGKQSMAGQAGSAHAGASGGEAGNGGSGDQGGARGCVDGLEVVKVVPGLSGGRSIISWPNERRIGALVNGRVSIYELGDEGDVTLIETLRPQDLGFTAEGRIDKLRRYGNGFLVQGTKGADPGEPRIVIWRPDAALESVPLPEAPSSWLYINAADPEVGIAAATKEGVRLATFDSDSDVWIWSAPFASGQRYSQPLAIAADRILVGVDEAARSSLGGAGNEGETVDAGGGGNEAGGGAGGAGAGGVGGATDAPDDSRHARVEWWSLSGQRLETHEAFGNPHVAVEISEGWLIGETNSFWGSYSAGVELLPKTGALRKLTDVPVISAADGTDGAYDLALLGERLLVANCESGLLAGDWSTTSVTLSPLPGPWQRDKIGSCSATQVEVQGDFAIVGGDQVVFARACE